MKFMLTNDDGIDAPGLAALAEAVGAFGATTFVAPRDHHSGCGHRVTVRRLVEVDQREVDRFAVNGTPADCARLGVMLVASDADWVLSGINEGGNLGIDVFMSGTVAAAREAALLGKRAVAFSQYRRSSSCYNWPRAVKLVGRVLPLLLERPLGPGSFWNVNFPDLADETIEPAPVFCPLDSNPLPVVFEQVTDGYHYRGVYHDRVRSPGADVDVCFSGQIAITEITPHGLSGNTTNVVQQDSPSTLRNYP